VVVWGNYGQREDGQALAELRDFLQPRWKRRPSWEQWVARITDGMGSAEGLLLEGTRSETERSARVKVQEPGIVMTPVIPVLGMLRQKDLKFEASLGYMAVITPSTPYGGQVGARASADPQSHSGVFRNTVRAKSDRSLAIGPPSAPSGGGRMLSGQ
jgi:hypothetical protein